MGQDTGTGKHILNSLTSDYYSCVTLTVPCICLVMDISSQFVIAFQLSTEGVFK